MYEGYKCKSIPGTNANRIKKKFYLEEHVSGTQHFFFCRFSRGGFHPAEKTKTADFKIPICHSEAMVTMHHENHCSWQTE